MNETPTVYESDKERTARVAVLNDRLRKTFSGGRVVLTQQVDALEYEVKLKVFGLIRGFDDFTQDNDPYGEHDFGAVEADGEKIFWKIDYFDNNLEYHSLDKSVEAITTRVLTIMKVEEY